tara:strand:- start:6 stop:530 length:525 start_codon:yes stop_codon:yes gene_type:complete
MSKNLNIIIIAASNGKNLELANQFQRNATDLKLSSKVLDLTAMNIPLFNPRNEPSKHIPQSIHDLKDNLFLAEKWIICAPEYNGSIPPILSNSIAWLSILGEDFRELFNGRPIAISTYSGGLGLELLIALRIQLAHLGSQVLGRQLSAANFKPPDEKSIQDILNRLIQMKKIEL